MYDTHLKRGCDRSKSKQILSELIEFICRAKTTILEANSGNGAPMPNY